MALCGLIAYYMFAIFINSHHEFDRVFSDVLYSNVKLTKQDGISALTNKGNHYQINTMAILHHINQCIRNGDYIQAIKHMNEILEVNKGDALLRNFFLVRKGVLGILACDDYNEYTSFLDKELGQYEFSKLVLCEIAQDYYNQQNN